MPIISIPLGRSLLLFSTFALCLHAADEAAPVTDGGDAMAELAKKTQDPTADIISFPIQVNIYTDVGPSEGTQTVVNLQPVYPVTLSDDWKLITRYILPIMDSPVGMNDRAFGLGDLSATAWLSPKKSATTWGAGLTAILPTATNDGLGFGKWGVGPSAVLVLKNGPWVGGGLLSHVWSVAGDGDRADVSITAAQAFLNYNLGKGKAFSYAPTITYNWKASSGNRLTFPLGLGYSQTKKISGRPMKFSCGVYYNVVRPDFAARWQTQVSVSFIIPK